MAFTPFRTWVAGTVLTAAANNTDIRDNGNAMRSGGIAIANQSALDFLYAASPTQLGRIAKGTALQYPRINAGETGYEFATPISDHGALTGLADDDHAQYSRADGSRAFTAAVSGVAPTLPAHLGTKGWAEAAFAPSAHTHPAADVTSGTFANARIAVGNVTQHNASIAPTWANVSGKPATFTPTAHSHGSADITTATGSASGVGGGTAIVTMNERTYYPNAATSGSTRDVLTFQQGTNPSSTVAKFGILVFSETWWVNWRYQS